MKFNLPNLSIKIPANGDKMTTKIAGMVKLSEQVYQDELM